MRFREKGAATTSKTYRKSWYQSGKYLFDTDELHTRSTHWNRMLDVVTPSFHRVRNQGGIICSPMYRDETYHDVDRTIFNVTGAYDAKSIVYNDSTAKGLEGTCPVAGISSSGDPLVMQSALSQFDREVSLAVTRAHADVDLSEMNVLASAGELPETIAWIRSLIQRVVELTKVFRGRAEVNAVMRKLQYAAAEDPSKFNLKRFERYVALVKKRKASARPKESIDNTLLNLWLEYRYAVRPLIVDIQNAIKVLDTAIASKRLTARGHEYVVGKTSSAGYVQPTPVSNSIGAYYTIDAETSVKARAGCLYVVDAHLTSMLDVLGFDQPLVAAYELTRFSFMLDWVFSVGDLLQSWFKSSGLSVITSWVTLSVEVNQTNRCTSAKLYPENSHYSWPNQQFVLGSSHSVVRRKWRIPNPALPLLPRFDLKINLAKLIDLGAIGRNIISGKKIPVVVRRS